MPFNKLCLHILIFSTLLWTACRPLPPKEKTLDAVISAAEITPETPVFPANAPVFIRITKTQSLTNQTGILEMFKQGEDGQFSLYKTWDICRYSGALGPKLREGDGQSPEGFYFVKPAQMNPNSSYHLSFNLGFPNAYDRAHDRTGSFLMVHGNCVSIGCYAMTDEGIEEIYTEMTNAFEGGQPFIRVHIFPFPMTEANMTTYADNPNIAFWNNLRDGWDAFETQDSPPNVTVRGREYVFETVMP